MTTDSKKRTAHNPDMRGEHWDARHLGRAQGRALPKDAEAWAEARWEERHDAVIFAVKCRIPDPYGKRATVIQPESYFSGDAAGAYLLGVVEGRDGIEFAHPGEDG